MNGFALGGAFEGFDQSRRTDIAQQQVSNNYQLGQQRLQLEQQAQRNQQQRELYARADKDASQLMSVAQETIQQLQLQGKSPQEIARAIQPILQPLKQLMHSAGRDPSTVDAQVAVSLAKPSFNPESVTGGAPQSSAPTGAAPSPPNQNITSGTVTGVDYGPVENRNSQGQTVSTSPAPQTNPASDVDRLTSALMRLPVNEQSANVRDAIKIRLGEAIKNQDANLELKTLKTEGGDEVPVIFNKRTGEIKGTDGQPYVYDKGNDNDAKDIAEAIKAGKQPPTLTGLARGGTAKRVKAQLARDDFDLTQADLEYKAAQKQVQSLNGPQMVRYSGLARSVINTIDEVKNLAVQMDNSGIPALNRAKLQAYIQLEGNSANGQLAAKYLAGINTLKEEFANLAQGGYAPTEAAWGLASQQINGDYGVKQLGASLDEVQRLLRYRLQGIPNFQKLGPGASNRYIGGGQPDNGGISAPEEKKPAIPPPPKGFVLTSPQ